MAGHSKWANIKHRKARQDAKKGKQWSKASRAIMAAAKQGGGDPQMNLALRYAIDEAKSVNMPKENVEKAIKKGTGELAGESYESVVYEGYASGGVAVMVEALTDNKNRTVGEVRHALEKHGGKLGTNGSVSFMFSQQGLIFLDKSAADEERIMELALEAGAQDVADDGESWRVTTEPSDFHSVRQSIQEAGIEIQMSELAMIPAQTVTCTGDTARKVLAVMDMLDDSDDIQKVHANYEIPEEEMAALSG